MAFIGDWFKVFFVFSCNVLPDVWMFNLLILTLLVATFMITVCTYIKVHASKKYKDAYTGLNMTFLSV